MIGQQVREFEIVNELGSGGYGAVYRAHDATVNRDVAIKVVLPQYASRAEFKQRFEAEARLVAQLEHPHIVPLYSYWQDEDGAFLVMRYIRGGSLRAMMSQQGALPLLRTVRILEQIADALDVAHSCGVVHRDLKPENILIDERGNAYLTDFGIAKQVDNVSKITEADAIVGTWAYLSPEQVRSEPVTPKADQYAFGILLYEMLAGEHPFRDTPIAMLILKHLQEPLPPVSRKRPDLPATLDDVIARATAKDPADRFNAILDVVDALKGTIQPGSARVDSLPVVPSPAKRKTTGEQRNRVAMLQNVRKFWIEGVLENSLHNAVMIDLGKRMNAGAVENPWNTVLRTPGGDEPLPLDTDIIHIFDRMNGKLLILGDPGGGKTTTLLELARHLLDRADADDEHPVPVVFNLSSWGEKRQPLETWLTDELTNRYQVPHQVAQTWVKQDALLLLLDGLDEVPDAHRNACVEAINTYRSGHGFVDLVVCSRTRDYEVLTSQLRLNGAIVIQPLTETQINDYLRLFGPEAAALRELISRDDAVGELAQSPLMLSVMVLAYRGVSGQTLTGHEDVESQRRHLFDLYVRRMFERRGAQGIYTPDETRHYLSMLARKLQQHGQSLFNIEDLQPTWLSQPEDVQAFPARVRLILTAFMGFCWLMTGLVLWWTVPDSSFATVPVFGFTGATYGFMFTHPWVLAKQRRHMFVSALIGILLGLAFTVGTAPFNGWLKASLFGVLFSFGFGVSGVPYHFRWLRRWRTRADRIVPLEKMVFSWNAVNWRNLMVSFPMLTTLPPAFALMLFPDQVVMTLPGLILGLSCGLVGTLIINLYLDGFTDSPVEMRLYPNEGMRTSVRNMIRFTFLQVVAFGTVSFGMMAFGLGLEVALRMWLAFFFMSGSDMMLSHGGIPVTQHLFLRWQLRRENVIPSNYARFLDYAASLVLLRKVGGGYIFMHRYLLEYFAHTLTSR